MTWTLIKVFKFLLRKWQVYKLRQNWIGFHNKKEKAFQVAVCEVMFYEQESTCHSRWVTTANGYLRMLIFNLGNFSSDQQHKLKKIISYIISVYVPSFIMIHLNPQAAQGPSLSLFQRDLILAYRQLEPDIADVVWKYFLPHASKWFSPINVALSVYAEVPPYSLEAVSSSSFPTSVNIKAFLPEPKRRLRHFFTTKSEEAPCIVAG